MVKKEQLKKVINNNSEIFRLLVIMCVVFLLIVAVVPNKSTFLSMSMLSSMMTQMPEIGIFATAVTFAMLLGGIDCRDWQSVRYFVVNLCS